MSARRRLWIRLRQLESGGAAAYADAIAEADRMAIGHGAHCWAFAVDGPGGLVVEFLEGPSDAAIESLAAKTEELVTSVAGAAVRPVAGVIGAEGVRCSEVGASD